MYKLINTLYGPELQALRAAVPPIEFKPDSGYRIVPMLEFDMWNMLDAVIPVPWDNPRYIAIRPGGTIPLHTDKGNGERFHIVLETNRHCWNFHDDETVRLTAGNVYIMDETREHASVNWGDTPRVHLVIDSGSKR